MDGIHLDDSVNVWKVSALFACKILVYKTNFRTKDEKVTLVSSDSTF